MKYLKILFIYILFISLECKAQDYTHGIQSWTKFQFRYNGANFIITSQIENRFNYLIRNHFIQTRFQITNNFDKCQLGVGLTFRPGEFRLHQIVTFNIHSFKFEQRFFEDRLLYRLRYMIYPEIVINDKHYLYTGIELMLQCSSTDVIKPEQLRIMLDYLIPLDKNYKIRIGYMSRIFNNYTITHVIRLTSEFNYTQTTKLE